MTEINLLPKGRKEERLIPFFILIGLIIGQFILLALIDSSLRLEQAIKGKEEILGQLAQKEEALKQELIRTGKQVSLGGADPQEVLAYIGKVRLKVPDVMAEITSRIPAGGKIISLDYAYPGAIQIQADFAKAEDAALFLNRLRHLHFAGQGIMMLSLNRTDGAAAGMGTPPTQPGQAPQRVATVIRYQASYTIPIKGPHGTVASQPNDQPENGGVKNGAKQ